MTMKMFGKPVPADFVYAGKKALEDALGEDVLIKEVHFQEGKLDITLERAKPIGAAPLDEGGWDANIHNHRCNCRGSSLFHVGSLSSSFPATR